MSWSLNHKEVCLETFHDELFGQTLGAACPVASWLERVADMKANGEIVKQSYPKPFLSDVLVILICTMQVEPPAAGQQKTAV